MGQARFQSDSRTWTRTASGQGKRSHPLRRQDMQTRSGSLYDCTTLERLNTALRFSTCASALRAALCHRSCLCPHVQRMLSKCCGRAMTSSGPLRVSNDLSFAVLAPWHRYAASAVSGTLARHTASARVRPSFSSPIRWCQRSDKACPFQLKACAPLCL